jgi:hypothetical protein
MCSGLGAETSDVITPDVGDDLRPLVVAEDVDGENAFDDPDIEDESFIELFYTSSDSSPMVENLPVPLRPTREGSEAEIVEMSLTGDSLVGAPMVENLPLPLRGDCAGSEVGLYAIEEVFSRVGSFQAEIVEMTLIGDLAGRANVERAFAEHGDGGSVFPAKSFFDVHVEVDRPGGNGGDGPMEIDLPGDNGLDGAPMVENLPVPLRPCDLDMQEDEEVEDTSGYILFEFD